MLDTSPPPHPGMCSLAAPESTPDPLIPPSHALLGHSGSEDGPTHATAPTGAPSVELRSASPDAVATSLRSILALDPDVPTFDERAADLRQPLPPVIEGLDAGAWIAWCLAGLGLFAGHRPGRLPPLGLVKASAGRTAVALAMLRSAGNLSQASASMETSRKVFRDNLRMGGLYPWQEEMCDP